MSIKRNQSKAPKSKVAPNKKDAPQKDSLAEAKKLIEAEEKRISELKLAEEDVIVKNFQEFLKENDAEFSIENTLIPMNGVAAIGNVLRFHSKKQFK